jgi:hypothetical protein
MQQHDGVSMNNVKEHHPTTQQKNMKSTYNNPKKHKTMQQEKMLIKIIEY